MKEIFMRTSVRSYNRKHISAEDMEKLLRAAMAAPSARNARPWQFIVVRHRETLMKLAEVSPYTTMLKEAAAAIIVLGDTEISSLGYCVQDCAAATENILLEATGLGIGSCWLGVYPNEDRETKLKDLFALPVHLAPLWMVSLGYPDKDVQIKDKWEKEKVHYERY